MSEEKAKPGIKTTEFAMSAGLVVIGIGVLIFGLVKGNDALAEAGIGLMMAGGVAYPLARGAAKLGKK